MKLNIYLIRLVRRIEKTIGKKETMNVLGISRCTLHRWKNDYYGLSVDNLEHISKKYVDLFPDEDIIITIMFYNISFNQIHMVADLGHFVLSSWRTRQNETTTFESFEVSYWRAQQDDKTTRRQNEKTTLDVNRAHNKTTERHL